MFAANVPGAAIVEVYGFQNYYNPSTLMVAADGALYGTASGAVNTGMVFRVTTEGAFARSAGGSPLGLVVPRVHAP